MANIELGLKSQVVPTTQDFKEYTPALGGNYNPYNQAYFDNPANMAKTDCQKKITSIPSPYARMHITELAFREYTCGQGIIPQHALQQRVMSADYRKALSHCLDIFELLYYSDVINLKENGVTLQKLDLLSTHSVDPNVQALFGNVGNRTPLYNYIKTLDLFRDEYVKVINKKKTDNNVQNYFFDFTSLYVLKYKGETIAATSPFTGFYAKAECDLREDAGNHTFNPLLSYNGHNYLTNDENDWLGVADRQLPFREFLYLLLKHTGLQYIFVYLFKAIKDSFINGTALLDTKNFTNIPEYQKFNIGQSPLQLMQINNKTIALRQDGIDCSYLKYMLYISDPVELTISKEEYDIPVANRRFPKDIGGIMPWIGVNDLLTDALFVLTYEINDNFITVPYLDKEDGQLKNRCLLPIKRLALDYFTINQLTQRIKIEKERNGNYVVTIDIPLSGGGSTILRKEYIKGSALNYPNGIVVEGEKMKPFAFGIYPFIKVQNYDNIYKILFYNSFEPLANTSLLVHNANQEPVYKLVFYKREQNGAISEYLQTEHAMNKTNDITNDELPVNCEYHHLSASEGLEFIELKLSISQDEEVSSIIYPNLKQPHQIPGSTKVAIDLGTSNTYVAYNFAPVGLAPNLNIEQINTHHTTINQSWNELTFMNKKCQQRDVVSDKNSEDLYLRTSDRVDAIPSDEWLSTQLLEFIPSRVDPTLQDSYKFPIPTVINFLRQNCLRTGNIGQLVPLLHSAIPFAYYENGVREGGQRAYYDVINEGSNFKWFAKTEKGVYTVNNVYKECFKAFMGELLFMLRSHLLSNGYPLNDCSLIWSYPLAFAPQLVIDYQTEWESAFRKYIYNHNNISDYVSFTNESRTPIYECMQNPALAHHLTLLMDIGGGSTDVIGYKNTQPIFITSFGFAGNSLYLKGEHNRIDDAAMRNSLLWKFVKGQRLLNNTSGKTPGFHSEAIGLQSSISEIMNYGFSKDPENFKRIFMFNDKPNYMLLFHNAAIIYHVAQLCKAKSPDEAPVSVYFTGNGSKLFDLNTNRDQMVRKIFAYVYSHEGTDVTKEAARQVKYMDMPHQPNPKASTANGALKGMINGSLERNQNSMQNRVVMLGDATTIFDIENINDGGARAENTDGALESVKQNVQDFIEMFYSVVYTQANQAITKDEVKRSIDFVYNDDRLEIPRNGVLSESLFFMYITAVMEYLFG